MIKIVNLEIQRYRSIKNMRVAMDDNTNIVTICGRNNVGKTNTLRAINLFFNPSEYEPQNDMPVFKQATGGASVYPKITITFFNTQDEMEYKIEKNWSNWPDENVLMEGRKRKRKRGTRAWSDMSKNDICAFLAKIKFYYLEAANIILPEIVQELTGDMLTMEYNRSRFSNSKKQLKEAYDSYVDGLQEVLDEFANSISETFLSFVKDWRVKFVVPKNSETFRDLISDDVELLLDDQGSVGIDDKGSGLQRLATILLQFEIAMKRKRGEHIIVCIDEPDIFLHEGLQSKLKKFFDDKAEKMQIMYTSHSKIFINTLNMQNIILLDAEVHKQYSARKKKDISIIETKCLDIKEDDGYEMICENLGIEKVEYNVLKKKNIIVEGNCDKKYLEQLMKYFGIVQPQIISANGASNIVKYLDFYESYYKNMNQYKPEIVVVYDNDIAGREAYKHNQAKRYPHLDVKHCILQNCTNSANIEYSKHNNTNNEIEDFVYPEVMCYLVNEILGKKNMNAIDSKKLIENLGQPAFKTTGFMMLCEMKKNENNPERGAEISFVSSGQATNQLKESLAGVFEIEGNRRLASIIAEADKKYPYVKMWLGKIADMDV